MLFSIVKGYVKIRWKRRFAFIPTYVYDYKDTKVKIIWLSFYYQREVHRRNGKYTFGHYINIPKKYR